MVRGAAAVALVVAKANRQRRPPKCQRCGQRRYELRAVDVGAGLIRLLCIGCRTPPLPFSNRPPMYRLSPQHVVVKTGESESLEAKVAKWLARARAERNA